MFWKVSPWEELGLLRNQLNDVFNRQDRTWGSRSFPLINVYDTQENVVVVAEIPGVRKEEIGVVMENGVLTLSGKRNSHLKDEKSDLILSERSIGSFEKAVRISVKVKEDQIHAGYSDGVLTVTLPKADEAKPKTIAIKVN